MCLDPINLIEIALPYHFHHNDEKCDRIIEETDSSLMTDEERVHVLDCPAKIYFHNNCCPYCLYIPILS